MGGLEEGGEESVPHHAVEVLTGMAARYNYVLAFTEERWHVIKNVASVAKSLLRSINVGSVNDGRLYAKSVVYICIMNFCNML